MWSNFVLIMLYQLETELIINSHVLCTFVSVGFCEGACCPIENSTSCRNCISSVIDWFESIQRLLVVGC